jgi:hypothetical protein
LPFPLLLRSPSPANDHSTEKKDLMVSLCEQPGTRLHSFEDAVREWTSVATITAPQLLEQASEDKGSPSAAPVSSYKKGKFFVRAVIEELRRVRVGVSAREHSVTSTKESMMARIVQSSVIPR